MLLVAQEWVVFFGGGGVYCHVREAGLGPKPVNWCIQSGREYSIGSRCQQKRRPGVVELIMQIRVSREFLREWIYVQLCIDYETLP